MPLQNQPFVQPVDACGHPYPGALAYYYVTGTLDAADVFTDIGLTVAHPHPVVADTNGLFPAIYTNPAITYRLRIKTALGVLIDDIDPISGGSAIGPDDLSDGAVTAIKIADGAVTAAKLALQSVGNGVMANMPNGTVKGNVSGATAVPADVTATQLWDLVCRPILRGQIFAQAANVTADDYYGLICDGRSLLRADPTYAALFAKIGTLWGSVDGTHFNLPDLRGYTLAGVMGARGLSDPLTIGQSHADQMQRINSVVGNGIKRNTDGYPSAGPFAAGATNANHPGTDNGVFDYGAITMDTGSAAAISAGLRAGLTTHGREAGVVYMIYY